MSNRSIELVGLDGTNPLGFLATLGVLVALRGQGEGNVRCRWVRRHTWLPALEQVSTASKEDLAQIVADALRGRAVSATAAQRLGAARKAMESAARAVKKKREEIRRRGLGRADRAEARDRELRPLEEEWQVRRDEYVRVLRQSVPRADLGLGKRIEDATSEDYRQLAADLLSADDSAARDELDQLAALGSDACLNKGRLQPTPFEFTQGSGHQFFLEDARKLIGHVTPERVHKTLFRRWDYRDRRLSMRWDPVEDRRYALLDRDPSDEGSRTEWMANLLAYRGLAILPTVPAARGLATVGWNMDRGLETFTWPLWGSPATIDTVASLVRLRELTEDSPDTAILQARGVVAVYRAQRIRVGEGRNSKMNFTPARAIL